MVCFDNGKSSIPLDFTEAVSSPEVFYKKGVLKNFVKLTRKHLCQNLFFNKVAGLSSLKKVLNNLCAMGWSTILN